MFDIREYYNYPDKKHGTAGYSISEIDEDIHEDIDNLFSNRFDRLYKNDTYKYSTAGISIIYPSLQYPGSRSIIMGPDKVRSLLSLYPARADLNKLKRIVLRPRFIDIGSVELVALYLRKSSTLVTYLSHPHYYSLASTGQPLHSCLNNNITDTGTPGLPGASRNSENEFRIHPLWYIISLISNSGSDSIEKFLIKKEYFNTKTGEILNDISFYYSRHGY